MSNNDKESGANLAKQLVGLVNIEVQDMGDQNSFHEWIEKRNIRPIELEEKDELYCAIMNIEHSFTGRADLGFQVANTFIMESSQLLFNSIHLFELGYFDCAFYSLREAIEISTTIVYLSDMPFEEREQILDAWKSASQFPMQNQMITRLSNMGETFSELKTLLSTFFDDIKVVQKSLNKYVHKQGFSQFYVSRNHMFNQNKPTKQFVEKFLFYFKKAIAAVAVMRLAIDPYPILLMDDEIRCRVTDWMTEPYSYEFVSEYLNEAVIDLYKQSDLYISFYTQIMREEKINPYAFEVIENGFIDTTQLESILSQKHLLNFQDFCAVKIMQFCENVTKIYLFDGWKTYFSTRKSNRPAFPWTSTSLYLAAVNPVRYNQPYDEAFISTLVISKKYFFIEHNEIISEHDILKIKELTLKLTDMFPDEPYPDPDIESIRSMIDKIGIDKL